MLVVFHLARASGTVAGSGALDEVWKLPSYHYSVRHFSDGDTITAAKDLFGTLDLGFVVLAHEDRERVFADYARVREMESRVAITGQ